jgi:hypothetical protein
LQLESTAAKRQFPSFFSMQTGSALLQVPLHHIHFVGQLSAAQNRLAPATYELTLIPRMNKPIQIDRWFLPKTDLLST